MNKLIYFAMITCFLFHTHVSFSQEKAIDSIAVIDSIRTEINAQKYGEKDFEKMKTYFGKNPMLFKIIEQNAPKNDPSVKKLQKILNSSYQDALTVMKKEEIHALIHAYYKGSQIRSKFKELDEQMDFKMDSLKKVKEDLLKEIKKDLKTLDSLKKNK